MNKIFTLILCALSVSACSENNSSESKLNSPNEPISTEIKVGEKINVINELNNKEIKINAFEAKTHLSGNENFLYEVEIENKSDRPVVLIDKKILLIDSQNRKIKVGLVDDAVTKNIEPNKSVKGIIGFEGVKGTPKYLQFQD
ncbi:hypothetical protein ACT4U9_09365 [Acinetobacter baumannii]